MGSDVAAQARKRAIKQNEGLRLNTYNDLAGNKAIGYGANISEPSVQRMVSPEVISGQRSMTTQEAETLLNKQYETAVLDARNFVGAESFARLDPGTQQAVIDMSFNMGGPRLGTFKKLQAALASGDRQRAASEVLNSEYAKQLPERAKRNAALILQGGYDTKLTPAEEPLFHAWKNVYAPDDSGIDYDLRGAFKAGLKPGANGHWPDTYKKPNHPTFSTESIYAKDKPGLAGSWNGETYIPVGGLSATQKPR